ncbi:hypothetical protein ACHWQZ_G009041 [Mnemiopsis leidyi]
MKTLLLLALTVSLVASKSLVEEFFDTMEKYHVSSRGLTSSGNKDVVRERFLNFKHFKSEVDRINGDDSIPFTAEVNMFSTLTDEEKKQYTGLNISNFAEEETVTHLSTEPLLPTSSQPKFVDWVSRGANPAMKNQGSCGSCWAFGTVSAIESTYFLTTGDLVSFSEQELLDCTYERQGNRGCQGGWLSEPINYVKQSGRLASSQGRSYQGRDGACNYSGVKNSLTEARVTGFQTYRGDSGLLSGVTKGVVSVALYVGNSFQSYRRGIYQDERECSGKSPNHAVTVVGYGSTEGQNYWRVRNSWGTQWGDGGYIRMSRDVSSNCGIASHVYRPLMQCSGNCSPPQFEEQEQEEFDDKDDSDNFDSNCENEKKDRYCEKYKRFCPEGSKYHRFMAKNCKKTCQQCDDGGDDGGKCPPGTVRCSDGVCKHEHMCHFHGGA